RASTVGHLFGGPTGYLTVGYLVRGSRHVVFDEQLRPDRDGYRHRAFGPIPSLLIAAVTASADRPLLDHLEIFCNLLALCWGQKVARNDVLQTTAGIICGARGRWRRRSRGGGVSANSLPFLR